MSFAVISVSELNPNTPSALMKTWTVDGRKASVRCLLIQFGFHLNRRKSQILACKVMCVCACIHVCALCVSKYTLMFHVYFVVGSNPSFPPRHMYSRLTQRLKKTGFLPAKWLSVFPIIMTAHAIPIASSVWMDQRYQLDYKRLHCHHF